jgi:hypothetical protein
LPSGSQWAFKYVSFPVSQVFSPTMERGLHYSIVVEKPGKLEKLVTLAFKAFSKSENSWI